MSALDAFNDDKLMKSHDLLGLSENSGEQKEKRNFTNRITKQIKNIKGFQAFKKMHNTIW